jgi:hypothetical protein
MLAKTKWSHFLERDNLKAKNQLLFHHEHNT